MKKIIISILALSSLIGVGFSIWFVTDYYSSYTTKDVVPEVGFDDSNPTSYENEDLTY